MSELGDFVVELMERHGAAVESLPSDRLQVLAPTPLRATLGWPELAQLTFGPKRANEAIPIGLEGDWLDRFGLLLGDRGRWAERQLMACAAEPSSDPARVLNRALNFPNAVWRFEGQTATLTRCMMLTFRYCAFADEKYEGLARVGLNLSTGAVLDEIIERMRPVLAREDWHAPDSATRLGARSGLEAAALEARIRALLDHRIRREMEPLLQATRRRLDRDRRRVHEYHEDLRNVSIKRLSALAGATGEKPDAERKREQLRMAAIERDYHSKLEDLRHHYAMRVVVEFVQALELYIPVQRFAVLIRRRNGKRTISIDWHPAVRLLEPPPCDWGLAGDYTRLVCDEKLHLTEPAGQAPCHACAKAWCRACSPSRCPRCAAAITSMPALF
jgi:hypothetical protein